MCGIVGIVQQRPFVSAQLYESLLMLQHRGQDAAGIVTWAEGHFREKKRSRHGQRCIRCQNN